ncbi:MAG: WG repeat-containing protein [Eubacteriales bacterium]|nr:WG repeat-containing protein [Eubacteriales bacterium]
MNNMKKLRRFAVTLIALLLLCAAAAAVIMYNLGWYDISFIRRSGDNENASESRYEPVIRPADIDVIEIEKENLSGVFNQEQLGSQSAETASQPPVQPPVGNPIESVAELKKSGYKWSDTPYNKATHRIGRVTGGIPLNKNLSSGGRRALRTYMGYILYDDGAHVSVLGINGVVSVAGIDNLTPAYARDSAGRPLFTYKDRYYYIVDNSNEMIEVEYNPLYAPPLQYDSPPSYSRSQSTLSRYYVETVHRRKIDGNGNDVTLEVDRKLSGAVKDGKDIEDAAVYARLNIPEYTLQYRDCILWGYLNAWGGIAIEAQYYFASEFNENGIAVVADANGKAKLINTYGGTVSDPSGTILYLTERNRRPAFESYYLPDTFGIESLGMFDFDHGLMRIRSCIYDYKEEGELVRDSDILIRPDGTKHIIPQDYTLVGYSDGVMLLEKDGLYGFLDYTGRWIAQPIYTYAQPFIEGLAVVGVSSARFCMIDNNGNIVLPLIYDYISNVSSGVIIAHSREGWEIFNKMSK